MPEIRAFARPDRDQLTELVNTHVAAVVPGWSLPVSALLAQFEREPAQYVVDPWVVDRTTLVAVERDRVVAGAHLKRYGTDERVMTDYHDAAEIAWLVAWPHKLATAHALARACTQQLDAWGVARQWAGSGLPTPATFGIPDAWPHVRQVIRDAGFSDAEGRTATLLAGPAAAVPEPGSPPVTGLELRREVDNLAVRFTALLDGEVVGYANIHDDLTRGGTMSRLAGWAELREHFVDPAYRRQGVGAWLLHHAVGWARLGGCSRLLAIWSEELGPESLALLTGLGCVEIVRTRGRWQRQPRPR
jgi:GNAT superfamily N-acetyltransferase